MMTKTQIGTLVSFLENGHVESVELPYASYTEAEQARGQMEEDWRERIEVALVSHSPAHVTLRLKLKRKIEQTFSLTCPGCGGKIQRRRPAPVGKCGSCDGLISVRPATRNTLLSYVNLDQLDSVPDQNDCRYFDLLYLTENGVQRTHGWYDGQTRNVVQFG